MKKILNLSLTNGRHEIPGATNGSIFGENISPSLLVNPSMLEEVAFSKLWKVCYKTNIVEYRDAENGDNCYIPRNLHINLYVTGLTVALISVLNVCKREGITVTLFHYDRESNSYYRQEVA